MLSFFDLDGNQSKSKGSEPAAKVHDKSSVEKPEKKDIESLIEIFEEAPDTGTDNSLSKARQTELHVKEDKGLSHSIDLKTEFTENTSESNGASDAFGTIIEYHDDDSIECDDKEAINHKDTGIHSPQRKTSLRKTSCFNLGHAKSGEVEKFSDSTPLSAFFDKSGVYRVSPENEADANDKPQESGKVARDEAQAKSGTPSPHLMPL